MPSDSRKPPEMIRYIDNSCEWPRRTSWEKRMLSWNLYPRERISTTIGTSADLRVVRPDRGRGVDEDRERVDRRGWFDRRSAPLEIYAQLLDESIYLCSVRPCAQPARRPAREREPDAAVFYTNSARSHPPMKTLPPQTPNNVSAADGAAETKHNQSPQQTAAVPDVTRERPPMHAPRLVKGSSPARSRHPFPYVAATAVSTR